MSVVNKSGDTAMVKPFVPFSEPPWLMGLPNAYYNDSHRKWQKTCRAFVDATMMVDGHEWERAGDVPSMYTLVL
jgi:acyl-CoA dehydrogenase